MESKIKKEEAPIIIQTPSGNEETPNGFSEPSDAIPDQNISDLLKILEDLSSKKPLQNLTNLSEALHSLFEYEEELLDYIEKKSNLDPLKKETLRQFTYDLLSELLNNYTLFKIGNVKAAIRICFDALLNEIYKDKAALQTHFAFLSDLSLNESERVSAIESQINVLHEKFYLEFYEKCYENLQANIIPNYLLKGYAEKLNSFLLDNVSKECLNGFYEKFKAQQPEVKQMNFFLKNLLKRNLALFDQRPNSYFDAKLVETLFKIFVVSNLDYFDRDVIAGQVFVSKLKKYAVIMNVKFNDAKSFYEFYKSIFISLKKNKSNYNNFKNNYESEYKDLNNTNKNLNKNEDQRIIINNENTNNIYKKNANLQAEIEFSFDSELKSLYAEVHKSLKSPEIYYMIVFSFSLMLNDFVLLDFDEVVINPLISVNSRERQFLLNLLKSFNKHFDDSKLQYINHKSFPFYLNSIVESFIAKKIIKDEKIQIFGLDENNKKIEIDHKIIIESIMGLDESGISDSDLNVNYHMGDLDQKTFWGNLREGMQLNATRRVILSHKSEQSNSPADSLKVNEKSELELKSQANSIIIEHQVVEELAENQNLSTSSSSSHNNSKQKIKNKEKEYMELFSNTNNIPKLFDKNHNKINDNNDNENMLSESEIKLELNQNQNPNNNNNKTELNINIENSALNKKILEKYTKLKPQLKDASTLTKVFSLLNNFLSLGFGGGDEVADAKLELEKLKIRPLNNYIFSLNTSIFFSGFLSEGSDHYNAWKFFKFSLDENKEMHSFEWPALSYYEVTSQVAQLLAKASRIYLSFRSRNFASLFSEIKNIKSLQDNNIFLKAEKIAKLSGKILAFAIAKRKIFRAHSINLIGFSLGCQVIKSFLKELFELSQSEKSEELNSDLLNIVQNVVFIGGAVDFKKSWKWGKIFSTLVAGKVVNIHCEGDWILKRLYKAAKPRNEPIGIKKLEIPNCVKIENYDVTSKNDGHLSYRSILDHIMMDVDLDL